MKDFWKTIMAVVTATVALASAVITLMAAEPEEAAKEDNVSILQDEIKNENESGSTIPSLTAKPIHATGIYKEDGIYRYFEKGIFKKTTGVALCPEDGKWRYVKNGIFAGETGVAERLSDKKWVYVKKGVFKETTGAARFLHNQKYAYVKKGIFNKKTGLVKKIGSKQWVLMKKGKEVTNPKKFFLTKADEKAGRSELLCKVYARCLYNKIIKKPKMSKRKKLLKCFYYVESPKHYSYLMNRIPYYTEADWPVVTTLDMIRDGGSTCFGYNALFAYLARLCGYKNVYFCCTKTHGWAEIDGRVFDLVFLEPPHNQMVFETTYEEADAMGLGHYYTDILRRTKVPKF